MPRKILFVGGIHGVGKSTLCDSICERMNVAHHSASELISKFGKVSHSANKRVTDVGKNQDVLIAATNEYLVEGRSYLLDGHFCLLNQNGEVVEIPLPTFKALSPVAIMVLFDDPNKIFARLKERDKEMYDIDSLCSFQLRELDYSESVASKLNVPYLKANPIRAAACGRPAPQVRGRSRDAAAPQSRPACPRAREPRYR